jgi:hypothetical protein
MELLGFVVHPEHALGDTRIARLSTPRVTSQEKFLSPSEE